MILGKDRRKEQNFGASGVKGRERKAPRGGGKQKKKKKGKSSQPEVAAEELLL